MNRYTWSDNSEVFNNSRFGDLESLNDYIKTNKYLPDKIYIAEEVSLFSNYNNFMIAKVYPYENNS